MYLNEVNQRAYREVCGDGIVLEGKARHISHRLVIISLLCSTIFIRLTQLENVIRNAFPLKHHGIA
jgi:hypothetical protein